jgi:hypothetical protein
LSGSGPGGEIGVSKLSRNNEIGMVFPPISVPEIPLFEGNSSREHEET